MSSLHHLVCIVIRSCRVPPISTLENFALPKGYTCILLVDPRVYREHKEFYSNNRQIVVQRGVRGLSAQSAACYTVAATAGFPWYFRLDDDLTPGYFVHKDGRKLNLKTVIRMAYDAAKDLDVSLVGFTKSSNRFWMKPGSGRVFGLIHGGAALFHSTTRPEKYIDVDLPLYDDVYQSCAHRKERGAVGRVREVGLDLLTSAQSATVGLGDPKKHNAAKKIILAKWSDYLTCDGPIAVARGGRLNLPWRFKRHAHYQPLKLHP